MKSHRTKHFETPDALRHDVHTLSEDAEALLEATKEIVDEKVKAAREQLATTIEQSRKLYDGLQRRAIESAKYADEAIHAHPYHTAFVALGVGAIIGFLCARRR